MVTSVVLQMRFLNPVLRCASIGGHDFRDVEGRVWPGLVFGDKRDHQALEIVIFATEHEKEH